MAATLANSGIVRITAAGLVMAVALSVFLLGGASQSGSCAVRSAAGNCVPGFQTLNYSTTTVLLPWGLGDSGGRVSVNISGSSFTLGLASPSPGGVFLTGTVREASGVNLGLWFPLWTLGQASGHGDSAWTAPDSNARVAEVSASSSGATVQVSGASPPIPYSQLEVNVSGPIQANGYSLPTVVTFQSAVFSLSIGPVGGPAGLQLVASAELANGTVVDLGLGSSTVPLESGDAFAGVALLWNGANVTTLLAVPSS